MVLESDHFLDATLNQKFSRARPVKVLAQATVGPCCVDP